MFAVIGERVAAIAQGGSSMDMRSAPLRIAVCAEAFGFGPASKAAAILSRLSQDRLIDTVTLTCSIAQEFLIREGHENGAQVDIRTEGASSVAPLLEKIDLALLVLIPEWLPVFSGRVPIVYVDSLGFMWPDSYYNTYPLLRDVDAYIVQDVFRAADRVSRNGVRNVKAVGALTPSPSDRLRTHLPVIHLGGGVNIFSVDDGPFYAEFAARLLDGLVLAGTSILTSRAVRDGQPRMASFHAQTLSHDETMRKFAGASIVFTSPGMTALLELASVGTPVIPLPPQNLSQAIIVREMAAVDGAAPIWRFLAKAYPVATDCPEEEGVARVRALNRRYADENGFHSTYRAAVQQEMASPLPLPKGLVSDFNGLDDLAALVWDIVPPSQQGRDRL
jgi:hypothetical protein